MGSRKLSAAVIVGGEKILLIKRKYDPGKGMWCAPGGFVNKKKNESVEDCAIRETKEETNIDIEIVRRIEIVKRYDNKKRREEEIHIFLAKPLSEEIITGDEVLDVRWFDLREMPLMASSI